jgi:hypothetical protein
VLGGVIVPTYPARPSPTTSQLDGAERAAEVMEAHPRQLATFQALPANLKGEEEG